MRKVKTITKQSLFDIAVQECGSVTAVIDIALANNISITNVLSAGTELKLPEAMNQDIVGYFSGKSKKIATALTKESSSELTGLDYVLPGILPLSL